MLLTRKCFVLGLVQLALFLRRLRGNEKEFDLKWDYSPSIPSILLEMNMEKTVWLPNGIDQYWAMNSSYGRSLTSAVQFVL